MDLDSKSVGIRYIESFYFSVATVMLIGTKGETTIETVFLVGTLLITVGVFAYLISTISKLFSIINK